MNVFIRKSVAPSLEKSISFHQLPQLLDNLRATFCKNQAVPGSDSLQICLFFDIMMILMA